MPSNSETTLARVLSQAPQSDNTSLGKNPKLIEYWRNLSRDPLFYDLLSHACYDLGKYDPGREENPVPHIQSERNGGFKGICLIVDRLLNGYKDAIEPKK